MLIFVEVVAELVRRYQLIMQEPQIAIMIEVDEYMGVYEFL
jgi:hypothetical protein